MNKQKVIIIGESRLAFGIKKILSKDFEVLSENEIIKNNNFDNLKDISDFKNKQNNYSYNLKYKINGVLKNR